MDGITEQTTGACLEVTGFHKKPRQKRQLKHQNKKIEDQEHSS